MVDPEESDQRILLETYLCSTADLGHPPGILQATTGLVSGREC